MNLARKRPEATSDVTREEIPPHWTVLEENEERMIYIRPEKWEFCGQRGLVELVLGNINGVFRFFVKCHGFCLDLDNYLDFEPLIATSARQKELLAITFIEKSL